MGQSDRFAGGEQLVRWPRERPGKVGGKRDENRRKRIATLCEAALPLFLQHGIEGVTVEDITKSASMAKGSFYRYFQDKEELVDALFGPLAEGVQDALARCYTALQQAEQTEAMFSAYRTLGDELTGLLLPYLDLVRLYLQECRAPAVGARKPVYALAHALTQAALQLTEVAHTHGLLRELPAKVSTLVVIGAIEQLLFAFLQGTLDDSPQDVVESLISIVLDGMRVSRP